MNLSLSKFKTMARATLVAASLAASVVAMPTSALAQPKIDFGIQFGGGGGGGGGGLSFEFGTGGGGFSIGTCINRLSRGDIRRGLRRADFEDIEFIRFTQRRAVVIAEWDEDGRDYRIDIDRCRGIVTDIDRIRR
jgi:hypothetical protein